MAHIFGQLPQQLDRISEEDSVSRGLFLDAIANFFLYFLKSFVVPGIFGGGRPAAADRQHQPRCSLLY
jgi:hypothetical protein